MAKFKFIGTDGSMGYKHGKVYRGSVQVLTLGTTLFFPGVFPFNLHRTIIPYSNIKAFEQNWERQ